MRQFSLKNNIGEVYRLNSLDNFLHQPEGLGFKRNATYKKIGNSYEILKDGFEQTPFTGRIMFKSDNTVSAYRRYSSFESFLQEIPLTLIYRIPGGEYRFDCIPESIEKTEINSALGMDVGIILMPISLWYKEILKTISGRSYIDIASDSTIPSPCHVLYTPASSITSLTWGQSVSGQGTIITGGLSGISLSSSDELHIRTDSNPYKIYKTPGNTDYYGKSDFSKKRFILLHKGTNTIQFNVSGSITIEARILYETV